MRKSLKVHWDEIRRCLANLRRAELIRRRRIRKEMERSSFFKNPFLHYGEDEWNWRITLMPNTATQHGTTLPGLIRVYVPIGPQNHQACLTRHHANTVRSCR